MRLEIGNALRGDYLLVDRLIDVNASLVLLRLTTNLRNLFLETEMHMFQAHIAVIMVGPIPALG
jgi:hypothetical protein